MLYIKFNEFDAFFKLRMYSTNYDDYDGLELKARENKRGIELLLEHNLSYEIMVNYRKHQKGMWDLDHSDILLGPEVKADEDGHITGIYVQFNNDTEAEEVEYS